MRRSGVAILLLTVTVFSLAVLALAQGTQSNGERIRLLRDEIRKRETAAVPLDLIELNRSKLVERRAELRTLVLTEIDNLRKYKTSLGTLITPEETQKIEDSIQEYDAEAKALGDAIQNNLATHPGGQPTPSPPQQIATAGPSPTNPQRNPIAPTPTPTPQATKATEETQKTGAVLNCKDVRAAQNVKVYSELDKNICTLADSIPAQRVTEQVPTNRIMLHGYADAFRIIKIIIAKKYTPAFLVDAEEARLDKQVAGAPSNAGSTSLVVKGGAPAILGFAVENGALTKSVNGTAITFRGNPVGMLNALANKGFVTSVKSDEQDPMLRFLKKTSFSFTFNADRGSQPGVFTATKQQLSSVSARIEFINKRKPELYIKDWETFLDNVAQPLTNLLNNSPLVVSGGDESAFPYGQWKDPALQAWYVKTQQALAEASETEISSVIQDRLDKLPIKELSPDTVAFLDQIEKQMGLYSTGRDALLKKINGGTLVTFEYLNKREVSAPDTSNFNFIAEKGTQNGKVDFTFNGSLTMFNNLGALRNFIKLNPTLPPARRFRDFQFAGQIDVPFGNVRDFGQFVLFAGGRYQRLLENASTDIGTVLPKTKGDIGYLQLGIKVPIKGTGFKIPFSVTFANRTELVKERTVRGNFGFTLDLDTLFAKLKPF